MKRRPGRTPIVEKKIKPGENLPPPMVPTNETPKQEERRPAPTLDRAAVQRAIAQRGELNRVTDELTAKISQIEEQIAALKIGVTGEVPIMVVGDRIDSLGWAKLGDKWRLCYVIDVKGQQLDRKPLVHATRGQRMSAVPFFVALVNELASNAERELERVEHAIAEVREFTAVVVESGKVTP